MSSNVISTGSIVTGVEFCKPFALSVLGETTADLVCVGPGHGRVVANGSAEPEGLDVSFAEESNLIVPVSHSSFPISGGAQLGLFINVKILSDSKAT